MHYAVLTLLLGLGALSPSLAQTSSPPTETAPSTPAPEAGKAPETATPPASETKPAPPDTPAPTKAPAAEPKTAPAAQSTNTAEEAPENATPPEPQEPQPDAKDGESEAAPPPLKTVRIQELRAGKGPQVERHSFVRLLYRARLSNGKLIESYRDRNNPYAFMVGGGQVIPGFDEAVIGMRAGGKRQVTIPSHLAYGKLGAGRLVPPNATLHYEIELLEVEPPAYDQIGNKTLEQMRARGAVLVDVRSRRAWKRTGIIPGSHPIAAFGRDGHFRLGFVLDLSKVAALDDEVILISRIGKSSANLAAALIERGGFTRVFNLRDGIRGWLWSGRKATRQFKLPPPSE